MNITNLSYFKYTWVRNLLAVYSETSTDKFIGISKMLKELRSVLINHMSDW